MLRPGQGPRDDQAQTVTLSDIENLILPPPHCLDSETAAFVDSHRRQLHEIRLTKLNARINEFERIWPAGSPILFFIAFGLAEYDIDLALERLANPAFTRVVMAQANATGYGSVPLRFPSPLPPRPLRPPPASSDRYRIRLKLGKRASIEPENGRMPQMMAYHATSADELDLKTPSPIDRCDKGDLRLTFVKGGERFTVGSQQMISLEFQP
jgi:hypothetical protein